MHLGSSVAGAVDGPVDAPADGVNNVLGVGTAEGASAEVPEVDNAVDAGIVEHPTRTEAPRMVRLSAPSRRAHRCLVNRTLDSMPRQAGIEWRAGLSLDAGRRQGWAAGAPTRPLGECDEGPPIYAEGHHNADDHDHPHRRRDLESLACASVT